MRIALAATLMLAAACATTYVPRPSKDHPVAMCAVSCGRGGHLLFARQHLCSGGSSRLFTDFIAVGRQTERGPDGMVQIDKWIGIGGDYNVSDTETMTCAMYILQLVQSRDPAQRGQDPGEDYMGRPIR